MPASPEEDPPVPNRRQGWVQDQISETPLWVREPEDHPLAVQAREASITQFSDIVLSGIYEPEPPVRGPFGEAEIGVKPGD